MLPNIGAPELIIILVIALLILGPGKLPDVGASLGKSIREFRKASSDVQDAVKVDVDTSPLPAPDPVAQAAPAAAPAPVAETPSVAQTAPTEPAPQAPAPTSDSSPVAR